MWLCLLINLVAVAHCGQYSASTLSIDSLIPSNPGISNVASLSSSLFYANNSELVVIPTMEPHDGNESLLWNRSNCPHLRPNLTEWSSRFNTQSGGNISIENGSNIIITKESLPSPHTFNIITVEAGGILIFDDANIHLNVSEIRVLGQLLIGSATCRLYAEITIMFFGDNESSSSSNADATKPSKGLLVDNGIVDVHGKEYKPTWTRLARTITNGSDIVFLQDCVNWEVQQQILFTTTSYHDCPNDTYLRDYCASCVDSQIGDEDHPECDTPHSHQNEIFEIIGIDSCNILQINGTTKYTHFASMEYQGEVALISRRINFVGERNEKSINSGFGGHIRVAHERAQGRFSGVRADFMGQLNVMGRYPFHFHELMDAKESFLSDNAVTNSQYRCFTLHRTNSSLVTKNVAYNAYGHCFYLEDGVEEHNEVSYNLAAHIHPIKAAAISDSTQTGDVFEASDDLINPADTSASGFYILNAFNNLTGNAASGGWSGFAFINTPYPLRENTSGPDWGRHNPLNRPNLVFDGNTAHSSGFYWDLKGACFYIGGWLEYDNNDVLEYDFGRFSRETYITNASVETDEAWMRFTNTKASLCHNGVLHWGLRMVLEDFEVADSLRGAQMFGESAVYKAVMTARTDNVEGWRQQVVSNPTVHRKGFEFYGTGAKNILTEIKFKNFLATGNPAPYNTTGSDYAISASDNSDKFTPQGINAVRNISFENCDESAKLGMDNCGIECGSYHTTKGHKFYNIYDWDGSLIGSNTSSLIGSSSNWWNFGQDCYFKNDNNVWYCHWYPSRQIAYIDPWINGFNDDCYQDIADEFNPDWCSYPDTGVFNTTAKTRDDSFDDCSCNDNPAFTAYSTGYISQWGTDTSTREYLGGWPGITGIANTAWHWSTIFGAPESFTVGLNMGLQIARGYFILLSMKYPKRTNFTVTVQLQGDENVMGSDTLPPAESLEAIMANEERINDEEEMDCASDPYSTGNKWWSFCRLNTTGGVGPSWYFDANTGYFYLRVVNLMCYTRKGGLTSWWDCRNGYFELNGIKVWNIEGKWNYLVETECDGCNISRTYNGITFYATENDVPPTDEFPAVWISEMPSLCPTATTSTPTVDIAMDPTTYHESSDDMSSSSDRPTATTSTSTVDIAMDPTTYHENSDDMSSSSDQQPAPAFGPTQYPTYQPSEINVHPTESPTSSVCDRFDCGMQMHAVLVLLILIRIYLI